MLSLKVDESLLDIEKYITIGLATTIASSSPHFRGDIKNLIKNEIEPSYRHQCIQIFYNMGHVPVGFVTWAWLSQRTEERLIRTGDPWIHISEWREGNSLWIRYFFVPPQQRIRAIDLCMKEIFPSVASARMMGIRKESIIAAGFDRHYLSRLSGICKNNWSGV